MKLCSSVENKEALTFSGNGDHDTKSNKSKKTNIKFCFPCLASGKKKGWSNVRGGGGAIRDVEMEIERGKVI